MITHHSAAHWNVQLAGCFYAAEQMEQIPSEYASEKLLDMASDLVKQPLDALKMIHGVKSGSVPLVYIGMLELLLAIWMIFFSGSMGILLSILAVQGVCYGNGIVLTDGQS